jgi:NhaP-type Na+/H+ or K+/H+ antiporter
MPGFSAELFLTTLGLVGVVIMVSALFSGVIERTGVPQVAVFLAMGALIGPFGFGLMDAGVNSPILRVVATLSLALVLFTDAVSLDLKELRDHKLLAGLILGPGTLMSAVLIAILAWTLLGLQPAFAAILGASLSSTDPVLLRSFLRQPSLERDVKQALRLESGMNDVVLLPFVLVAVALLTSDGMTSVEWAKLAVEMLILSPGVGILVAGLAIVTLEFVRRRTGIRRDYESIYSLGVAFAAFAAAEAFHGSGFLAAFAAGLTISALDVELCDCFLEYGETTAEMALLFTFVLFGTSVVWTGLPVISGATMAFAGLVFVARPVAFLPALMMARTSWRSRILIAWFGPRGLSSLLLVLLPLFAGIPGTTQLAALCSLVVLCSIVIHGFSPAIFLRDANAPAPTVAIEQVEAANPAQLSDSEYITIDEYKTLKATGANVLVADVRTARTLGNSTAAEAVRIDPERSVYDARAKAVPKGAMIAAFCW